MMKEWEGGWDGGWDGNRNGNGRGIGERCERDGRGIERRVGNEEWVRNGKEEW